MNTSDILGLVGKLSSLAQQPADSEAERTLQDSFSALAQAAESFFPLLFQSSHPQKSEFRRKFAQILQDARLFLRYPFLYGRTGVGLLTGKGAASAGFCGNSVRKIRQPGLQNSVLCHSSYTMAATVKFSLSIRPKTS